MSLYDKTYVRTRSVIRLLTSRCHVLGIFLLFSLASCSLGSEDMNDLRNKCLDPSSVRVFDQEGWRQFTKRIPSSANAITLRRYMVQEDSPFDVEFEVTPDFTSRLKLNTVQNFGKFDIYYRTPPKTGLTHDSSKREIVAQFQQYTLRSQGFDRTLSKSCFDLEDQLLEFWRGM